MAQGQPDRTVEVIARDALIKGDDPYALFDRWMTEAARTEPSDPNAMTVASVDETGLPDARIVLLKAVDDGRFVFYTNTSSSKGRQLAAQPTAALLFHWKSLARQVRIRGDVAPVSTAEADAYFASRPRGSQIGAWASQQSAVLDGRAELIEAVARVEAEHDGQTVPRPPHWSGYAVTPRRIEFWQDQPFRLHDRLVFERSAPDASWQIGRVYP